MKYNNLILLIFLFLTLHYSHITSAQIAYYNTETFWSNLKLLKPEAIQNLPSIDTAAIIATNRKYQKNELRFLSDEYEGGIRYFFVFVKNGKWQVLPVSSLSTAIQLLPNKNNDWVIYTEGMGKLFTTAMDRAFQMNLQYKVNVILLDYPSISSKYKRTRNYYFAKKHAEMAYEDFSPVLDSIKSLRQAQKMGNGKLNLFFHSMGNIVLEKLVKEHKIAAINNSKWVDNLILNAACVPQRNHKTWLDKINFSKRTYVLYNPNDYTLSGAYFMSKRQQLGMRVNYPLSKQAQYFNFETIVGNHHSNFLNLRGYPPQPKAAIHFYNILLHGQPINVNDTNYLKISTYRKIGWDIQPI